MVSNEISLCLLKMESYQALVNTTQSHGIDLTNIRCLCLQELFESHPVLSRLASGDADPVWLQSLTNSSVT
jgi:hypothetical protein